MGQYQGPVPSAPPSSPDQRQFRQGSRDQLSKTKTPGFPIDVETRSIGSLRAGLPLGRRWLAAAAGVVEIYGPESQGKPKLGLCTGGRGPEEGRHLRLHRDPKAPLDPACRNSASTSTIFYHRSPTTAAARKSATETACALRRRRSTGYRFRGGFGTAAELEG